MPVYCITGTNRGLGLEFVRQLAADADTTIIAGTRSLDGDLSDLRAISGPAKIHILACDTSDPESVRRFASEAKSILGAANLQVDFLLNNAGIRVNVIGPAKTVEFLNAESLLSANVRIVNFTSGLASMSESLGAEGNTFRQCCTYSISKAGLNMLAVHQSGDLRKKAGLTGAVVIVVDPGWVRTRMGGPNAVLEPHQSIAGVLNVVHGLTDKDNGSFYLYDGTQKPW
ncbi:unnamed protein product [Parascedosporium putredinis]|uniref:NAD(P)-binding protein n=1 Tax=Parascedosporium putredinis TaxID=1442378 RepID=A0A9P1GXL1_9PEZI|nr:unnamed protein product [Parascedosporium putredinis]CAI7989084.1 unnamed protein product [Parascedosporium putredinis]